MINAKPIPSPGNPNDAARQRTPEARQRPATNCRPPCIIGESAPIQELFKLVGLAARSDSTVLITGESGSGKELIARSLHEVAGRKGAFIPVNCTAVPAELIEAELFGHTGQAFTGAKQARLGLIEAASHGTLFLDEVGHMPLPMQPKLLRVLQTGELRLVGANEARLVDVRFVAATNLDLEAEVHARRFREDLFWRLNVIHLHIPPLRERPLDIPLLAAHFLNKVVASHHRAPLQLSAEVQKLLQAHTWPGNVRELENAIEFAVAMAEGGFILPADLPVRVRTGGQQDSLLAKAQARGLTLYELEKEYILQTLRLTGGNKSLAAQRLGCDRRTVQRKLSEYLAADPTLAV